MWWPFPHLEFSPGDPLWVFDLQNCKIINLYYLKVLNCGNLLQQEGETNKSLLSLHLAALDADPSQDLAQSEGHLVPVLLATCHNTQLRAGLTG